MTRTLLQTFDCHILEVSYPTFLVQMSDRETQELEQAEFTYSEFLDVDLEVGVRFTWEIWSSVPVSVFDFDLPPLLTQEGIDILNGTQIAEFFI